MLQINRKLFWVIFIAAKLIKGQEDFGNSPKAVGEKGAENGEEIVPEGWILINEKDYFLGKINLRR